jgi:CRP-like cAMP-binding protein
MTTEPRGNLILDSLTPETLRTLELHEDTYPITAVLSRPDETPKWVYFPCNGAVVSIVRSTEDGSMVESGVIGSEGLLNVQTVITEPAPTGGQAIVQIDGTFARVETQRIREQFLNDATVRDRVLSFTSVFLSQVTQNLVCNRLHAIEERLAKWLLIVRDRMDADGLHLTHDFLAHMLGIHRPGVSIAVNALELDGVIGHTRNMITIRDREGLEARACECFATIHTDLLRYRATFFND